MVGLYPITIVPVVSVPYCTFTGEDLRECVLVVADEVDASRPTKRHDKIKKKEIENEIDFMVTAILVNARV